MAKLFVKFDSAVIKEITLEKDITTFGRKPDNDVPIDNQAISGHHGRIVKSGGDYFVEDLGSTNGTYVNGHKVKKHKLNSNDNIAIARHVLVFVVEPSGASAPSAPPPQPAAAAAAPAPPTPAVPSPSQQKEILRKSLGIQKDSPASGGTGKPSETAMIRVVSGAVNGQEEIQLKDLVTYIGTSDQAVIKIKGMFAPSLAAAISRRPDGFFLKAVKAGYPKVNGQPVQQHVHLENGALIEVGGTNMVFRFSEDKNKNPTA